MTTTTSIRLTCEHCSRPVHAGRGGVRLYDEDLATAEAAYQAHQAAQEAAQKILDPLSTALSSVDLMRTPPPALWRVEHDRCAPAGGAYAIDAGRLTTTADALDWTLHLMGTSWAMHTDWEAFIRWHVLDGRDRTETQR